MIGRSERPTGLLAGVRVLESAALAAGGATGMLLADLGADVVKVESTAGDPLRYSMGQVVPGFSPAFLQLHRNKRGVVADLRTAAGRAAFGDLIAAADVLIDGNAVGTLSRHGFTERRLAELNPRLVHCTVAGYGTTGPYRTIPCHGMMMSAVVGEQPNPEAGVGDGAVAAAMSAALQVGAALYRRSVDGAGVRIDVSGADALLLRAMLPAVYRLNADRLTDPGTLPVRGNGYLGPRYRHYPTRDGGAVAFTVHEPKFWRRFCALVDRPDLLDAGDRTLDRELGALLGSRTRAEWVALAAEHGLPIGPAYPSTPAAADDPHLRARDIVVETVHPVAGRFTCVGTPAMIAGHPFAVHRPAPGLGEHTDEVVSEWARK